MKIIFCFLFSLFAIIIHGQNGQTAIESVLKDDVLLNEYFNCIMEISSSCPIGGEAVKDVIALVLEDGCKNCPPEVRENVWKVLAFLQREKPNMFKQLLDKFDPTGKHTALYESEVAKHG